MLKGAFLLYVFSSQGSVEILKALLETQQKKKRGGVLWQFTRTLVKPVVDGCGYCKNVYALFFHQ